MIICPLLCIRKLHHTFLNGSENMICMQKCCTVLCFSPLLRCRGNVTLYKTQASTFSVTKWLFKECFWCEDSILVPFCKTYHLLRNVKMQENRAGINHTEQNDNKKYTSAAVPN